jgi:Ni,Fe-hydrogenase maturation factor
MRVFVLGNEDYLPDSWSLELSKKLQADFPQIKFEIIKPNQDLPIEDLENLFLLDQVQGLKEVKILDISDLENLERSSRATVHDFDLGFQLKYLKKLGKIDHVSIIGIPLTGKYSYASVHSIFKKLVAHDMQGS